MFSVIEEMQAENMEEDGAIRLSCGTVYYQFICPNKKCTWDYNSVNKVEICPCCGTKMLRVVP